MSRSARILVIEDNEANLELMVYLLGAFGYTPLVASDGIAGLEMARTEKPDLIVCDVHLPRLDGFGVVAELKRDEELSTTPIIAVTALAMVGDRDRILAAGFNDYISKPIAPETFVSQVERSLPGDLRGSQPVEEPDREEESGAGKGADSSMPCLLLVDDNAANLDFLESTLRPFGYNLLHASGVSEALQIAERHSVDMVICDLHMAPYSGKDMLVMSRSVPQLASVPVVIISSTFTSESESQDCLNNGAAYFIKRPVEPQALLAQLEKILKEWRVLPDGNDSNS
jgi:two-component system cell cycle response regulator